MLYFNNSQSIFSWNQTAVPILTTFFSGMNFNAKYISFCDGVKS